MESAINLSPLAINAGWKLPKKARAVWMDVQAQMLNSKAQDPSIVTIADNKLAVTLKDFGLITQATYDGVIVPTKWVVPKEVAFITTAATLQLLHAKAESAGIEVL